MSIWKLIDSYAILFIWIIVEFRSLLQSFNLQFFLIFWHNNFLLKLFIWLYWWQRYIDRCLRLLILRVYCHVFWLICVLWFFVNFKYRKAILIYSVLVVKGLIVFQVFVFIFVNYDVIVSIKVLIVTIQLSQTFAQIIILPLHFDIWFTFAIFFHFFYACSILWFVPIKWIERILNVTQSLWWRHHFQIITKLL